MKALRLLAALLALGWGSAPIAAQAQIAYAQTVTSCGTPNNTPVVGNTYPITMDTTAKLCDGASGSGTASQQVQGTTADAAADTGSNPVKVGGWVKTTTLPNYSNGADATFSFFNDGSVRATMVAAANASRVGIITNTAFPNLQNPGGVYNQTSPLGVAPFLYNGTVGTFTNTEQEFGCANTAPVSVTAGNTTQIIALSGTTVIRVCAVTLGISATGTVNVVTGTGSNCATPATISNAIPLATGQLWAQSAPEGQSLFRSTAGGEICIAAVTGNVTGFITYAQY